MEDVNYSFVVVFYHLRDQSNKLFQRRVDLVVLIDPRSEHSLDELWILLERLKAIDDSLQKLSVHGCKIALHFFKHQGVIFVGRTGSYLVLKNFMKHLHVRDDCGQEITFVDELIDHILEIVIEVDI